MANTSAIFFLNSFTADLVGKILKEQWHWKFFTGLTRFLLPAKNCCQLRRLCSALLTIVWKNQWLSRCFSFTGNIVLRAQNSCTLCQLRRLCSVLLTIVWKNQLLSRFFPFFGNKVLHAQNSCIFCVEHLNKSKVT